MRRRHVGSVVGTLVLLAAAGCGDGEEPADRPSAASSATSSGDPSEPTEPTSAAPSGKQYSVGNLSFYAPRSFRVVDKDAELITLGGPQTEYLSVASQRGFGGSTTEDLAKSPSSSFGDSSPERLADRTIAGVTFYHLSGPGPMGYVDEYGAAHGGFLIQLTFLDALGDKAARQKWIEPILASVELP